MFTKIKRMRENVTKKLDKKYCWKNKYQVTFQWVKFDHCERRKAETRLRFTCGATTLSPAALPTPSCPNELSPQANSWPPLVSATLWRSPLLIWATVSAPSPRIILKSLPRLKSMSKLHSSGNRKYEKHWTKYGYCFQDIRNDILIRNNNCKCN